MGGAELDAGVVKGFEFVGASHDGVGIAEEGVECWRRGEWSCGRRVNDSGGGGTEVVVGRLSPEEML